MKKFAFGFVFFVIASCENQPELKWDEIDFYRISERAIYELHNVEARGTDSKALKELVYFNSPDTLNEFINNCCYLLVDHFSTVKFYPL
jgi:hypothetical protein